MSKILIVEDDLYERELYQRVLENAGYSVITSNNGQEGFQKAFDNPVLIVLDIMLPGKNGLVILQDLKENEATKHIPVLVLSNLGQENIINEALRSGAEAFVLKSQISTDEFIEKVKAILQKNADASSGLI